MQDAYLFAFCLHPPVILGRQMQPFSSAHLMELECVGSPLVHHYDQASPADLLAAIYICSFAWPFPWFGKAPSTMRKDVTAWGKSVSARWDFLSALDQWQDYFRSYWKAPERTHDPNSESAAILAPASIKIVAWLLRTLHGMTEERAWNMPICLALAYKAGCDALDGDKSLLDEDTIAVLDAPTEAPGEAKAKADDAK